MESVLALQTGRFDRRVRRSHLHLSEDASRPRVAYSLEEALRLAHLPGEDEGRIYCFRRVAVGGMQADANRRVWTNAVQRVLGTLAEQAVHAGDPAARVHNAIYFHNREEALEMLLRNALLSPRNAAPVWYSASLLGPASGATSEQQIPVILDQLQKGLPAPGAAAIVFAALEDLHPSLLLSAIPEDTVREWNRALEDAQNLTAEAPALPLPERLKLALHRAAAEFGWKDPGTLWLAAQAVLVLAPGASAAGTTVRRARSTLRSLEVEQRSERAERVLPAKFVENPRALVFDDESRVGAEPEATQKRAHGAELIDLAEAERAKPVANETGATSIDSTAAISPVPLTQPIRRAIEFDETPKPRPLQGEPTVCAGLYFLVNVLHRLKIAAALEECPGLREADFATHILKRLAALAGDAEDDPILVCLPSPQLEFTLPADLLGQLHQRPALFPAGFAPPAHPLSDSGFLLRVWAVAVRRWCWRIGRLTPREVVQRRGRVWLTRTDLDVTFPFEDADIRIRRAGLDIDPGWVPWLGTYGRVVRFHYRDPHTGAQPC